MELQQKQKNNFKQIFLLMLAGETIFLLPFVLFRIFRPTFLNVLELNNTQLGTCFSVYGISALVSYFLGGWFADRYAPGRLMGVALILTAIGGFYLISVPSYSNMLVLFGYWGVTTILLFWAALIKATRLWGGSKSQGKAYGFLEAGRGVLASIIGLIATFIFSFFIVIEADVVEIASREAAFQKVILFASLFVSFIGILIYSWFDSRLTASSIEERKTKVPLNAYLNVLKIPSVWLIMVILLCAYVGYKSTDFISQFADQIMGFDENESAKIGMLFLYLRPLTALLFGFLADRFSSRTWMSIGFTLTLAGAFVFCYGQLNAQMMYLFIIATFILGVGIYGTRTLYFSLMQEGAIPIASTGIAISIISVVGYLPDVFMGPLTGYFLDVPNLSKGFQAVFGLLTGFTIVGLIASLFFLRVCKTPKN